MFQRLAEALGRLRGRVLGLGPPDDLGLYARRYEWHTLKSSRARAKQLPRTSERSDQGPSDNSPG